MKKNIAVTVFAVTIFLSIFNFLSCSSDFSKVKKSKDYKILDNKEKSFHLNSQNLHNLIILENQKKDDAIKKYIKSLTLEEKISQIFLINLESDKKFIPVEWFYKNGEKKTLMPAGYIFFGFNISKNPEQIVRFTNSVEKHSYAQNLIPPFLSIDVEGGYVNRLRGVAGALPENKRVAEILDFETANDLYSLYAKQLNSLGFNLNLAPVSEVENSSNKDFLDGRSFGKKNDVIKFSTCAINSYQKNNVATTLKHFPGNSNVDPHTGLPKINFSKNEYDEVLEIFSKLIEQNPDSILMSHAIVSEFDKNPTCLSKFWVNDILRDKLNYDGVIFSDDIFMGALIDNGYPPRVASKMAIDAGINCIMISEKKFGHWLEILSEVCKTDFDFLQKIENSVFKILKLKLKYNIIQTEFDKTKNEYFIKIQTDEKNEIFKNKILEDEFVNKKIIQFNNAKIQTQNLYKKYFYETATNEEKKSLFVE